MGLFDANPKYENAKFPPLREFQISAHEALRNGYKAGHRNQLIMAPTGSGKTLLSMNIIHEALKKGKRAMFVCDRTTLINQTSEVADSLGLSAHGIIQADHWRYDLSLPFQIASVQTLARRNWPETDLVVVDEVHAMYKPWVDYAMSGKSPVIGLSATPFSDGLGKIFTNLINATTMDALVKSGILVPMDIRSCVKIDMRGAATAGGEWTDGAAQERGMEIIGDVVKEWINHADNRKTIVFGPTIAWCEEQCRAFNECGIEAAVLTSHTKADERAAIFERFGPHDSSLRVLISVEALAKGYDKKDISVVCDCRPLRKSLSCAIQMWGRGARSSPETSKADFRLLDFSGNIIRFMKDFSDIYYNGLSELDMGEKLDKTIRKDEEDEKKVKSCPSCSFSPYAGHCIACGHQAKSVSMTTAEAGQMKKLAMMGAEQSAAEKAAFIKTWHEVCTYSRAMSGDTEKQRKRAFAMYKGITGSWPERGLTFESAPNVVVSRQVNNKIRQQQIAYAKSRSAHGG